jgi:hypothetical protein
MAMRKRDTRFMRRIFMRALVTSFSLCLLGTLFAGCQLDNWERNSTDSQIRRNIAGAWQTDAKSDVPFYSSMILEDNGTFIGFPIDGAAPVTGEWRYQSRNLWIGSKATNSPPKAGPDPAKWGHSFPVVYADAHRLNLGIGMGIAGRVKFTRSREGHSN